MTCGQHMLQLWECERVYYYSENNTKVHLFIHGERQTCQIQTVSKGKIHNMLMKEFAVIGTDDTKELLSDLVFLSESSLVSCSSCIIMSYL